MLTLDYPLKGEETFWAATVKDVGTVLSVLAASVMMKAKTSSAGSKTAVYAVLSRFVNICTRD